MNRLQLGTYYAIDISGCDYQQLENYTYILNIFKDLIKMLNYEILGLAWHKFEPQGFSAVFVISASHLAIHTWPEQGYLGIDIFTCSVLKETDTILDFLNSKIINKSIDIIKLKRCVIQ